MFDRLKEYIFVPVAILILSVYLLGLSVWQNRSYPIPQTGVQRENHQAVTEETPLPDIKLNINTATKEDLMKVDGIGEKTAEKIIEKREQLGSFSVMEQVSEVKGIGEKTIDELKKMFTAE